ncbi:transposase [Clostridiaceae bacterium 35-E11]
MPRVSRIKSESGIYHIVMRGINRQMVFEDEEDSFKFIQTLQRYREICEYSLHAYCLMGNHVHLLLMEGKEPLETVMRRICGSYVLWYNKKYSRVGHLFQDRFKSEPVEDDEYFLTVLRYIFQNPIKSGIVAKIESYLWTNYTHYIEGSHWTDTDFALDIFDTDRATAVRRFIDYVHKKNNDLCLELRENRKLNDGEAIKLIKDICKVDHGQDLQKLEIHRRNFYIKELKEKHSLSIRQIERLTGISRGIIQRL